jgi:heat shock factor-binding protein 1
MWVNVMGSYFIDADQKRRTQVETLLEQLDTKFDEMSSQVLDRSAFYDTTAEAYQLNIIIVNQMSSRVDALEASIQDIINSDISNSSVPPSPAPNGIPNIKRTGSGLS